MNVEEMKDWLIAKEMPMEVIEAFEGQFTPRDVLPDIDSDNYLYYMDVLVENDMDGEALVTLIGVTPVPDCFKELVVKVGQRLKLYKEIKALYEEKVSIC